MNGGVDAAGTVVRNSRKMPPLATLPVTLPFPDIRSKQALRSAGGKAWQRWRRLLAAFCPGSVNP